MARRARRSRADVVPPDTPIVAPLASLADAPSAVGSRAQRRRARGRAAGPTTPAPAAGASIKWYQRSVGRTVSSSVVAAFSRQVASFIEAGISIVETLEIVAEESDLASIEPLEEPPSGNVNLKEIKRRFGKTMCLKGNINTTHFMLHATPEQIEEKCKRLIDDAGEGGGFILSTGDQCGRDTPEANLFKMVEVATTYGKY